MGSEPQQGLPKINNLKFSILHKNALALPNMNIFYLLLKHIVGYAHILHSMSINVLKLINNSPSIFRSVIMLTWIFYCFVTKNPKVITLHKNVHIHTSLYISSNRGWIDLAVTSAKSRTSSLGFPE